MPAQDPVLELLGRAQAGDPQAGGELVTRVYGELRDLAARRLASGPRAPTLQPTALVHEAWMRLVGSEGSFTSRAHFFGAAARAMRRVLVEHARRLRGRRADVELTRIEAADGSDLCDVLALDDALARLEERDPGKATVVTLRFLFGCTVEETAAALGCSAGKVKQDWAFARAWLARELGGGGDEG